MTSDDRHDRGAALRLTPRQEAFWLEDALFPDAPCNHVVMRLVVDGPLDEARLRAAFAAVVAANDAFQLACDPAGGPQLRAVRAAPSLTTATIDGEAAAARWRTAFLRPRFAAGEPLWRAALLRHGPTVCEFVLAQHHVVTDSRSCLLFVEQLAAAYAGAAPAAPPAGLADAMAGQRAWLASPAAAEATAFWRERLADAPSPCRLYGRDPAAKNGATRRVTVALSASATAALAARAHGASPAQWFAAATFAWLARVGEGEEFVVGVPLLNRQPDQERTLGLLMEIVPNRAPVAAAATMRGLLADVQAEVARVRPHRRWTVPARQARCDVVLNVHPTAPTTFAGMPCRYELTTPPNLAEPADYATAPGPWAAREAVTVQVHRHGDDGRFEVSLDLNAGMFDDALAQRAALHLVALLEAGLASPDARIDALPILGADEAARAAPRRPAACAGAPPTVSAAFLANARRSPARVAVRHRDVAWTYGELAAASAAIAGALRAAGVGDGDRVGVCLRRSPQLLAALLACARLGAAYVPLDPSHPGARLQLILADATPRACVVDADGRAALGELPMPCVDLDAQLAAPPLADDADHARADGVAYVLFTSGSTGRPKGVEVLHHGLGAFLAAMAQEPGCGPDDRVLAVTTVSFDIAALELFLPLVVGATVVLADRSDAVDPAALDRLLAARDVTLLQATPATYHLLLQNGWAGRPGLRALVGGEALPADLAAALLSRVHELWNMYGPTETTVWSTCLRVGQRQPIAIGRPIAGTAASVRTPSGALCPLGAVGELWLGGDGVAKGYLGRPELTAERFVDSADGRWYRTGDLARLADDGVFEFLGRNDFQVKVRGYRIELGEIESAIAAHPAVRQAVVVARGSGPNTALVGYAQAGADAPSTAELDAWLRARLPAYMVPARLCVLERFPLTPSGKVDRKALPEPAAPAPAVDAAPLPPRGSYEARIADYWTRALGDAAPAGARWRLDDDFFAVGGHSLAALELARLLQDGLGLGIDVGAIFARPTLRQQVALAEAGGAGATAVVTLVAGDASQAPIYAACGISLYAPLARALAPARPFHAVFVPEEEFGGAQPSAVELAKAYWQRIRAHHRGGPFHLLGFCYGGIVAFETARLARAEGAEVGSVVLVDTALWGVMRRNRVQQVWRRLRRLFAPSSRPAPVAATGGAATPAVVDTRGEDLFARARSYRPSGPHDGAVVLARVRHSDLLATWRATPCLGWEPWLAGARAVVEVGGDHDTMLQEPAVRELAAALSRRL